MKCKNCGARLNENSNSCPNCGAFIDEGSGYVLLTDNFKADDEYYEIEAEPEKKGGGIRFLIALVLVIAIVGAGAYYYFNNIYKPDDKPNLSFTSGAGIINDDETVVYVAIPENSRIEFIHGVTLYDYDRADLKKKDDPISTSYEYTKSIDGSFRAIFFDVDNFSLTPLDSHVYTFDMKFSFVGSDEIYSYSQKVEFSGEITENVADVIFDHSLDEMPEITTVGEEATKPTAPSTTKTTTTKVTESTTVQTIEDITYIYNSFWFTEPVQNSDSYDISSIKFNRDATFSETIYHKEGANNWTTSTFNGKYEISEGNIYIADSEGQIYSYPIDSVAKTLDGLTSRRYNSVKNAEDFFGI